MGQSYFDIDFTTVVVIVSAISVSLLQLLLCFKAKRKYIKLIPIALFLVSTVILSICSAFINGWDGIGYLFFALFSFVLTIICGIILVVWAIDKKRKR